MSCYNRDEWYQRVKEDPRLEVAREASLAKWRSIAARCPEAPMWAQSCGFCWLVAGVEATGPLAWHYRCRLCVDEVRLLCQEVTQRINDGALDPAWVVTELECLELEKEEDDALAEMAIG